VNCIVVPPQSGRISYPLTVTALHLISFDSLMLFVYDCIHSAYVDSDPPMPEPPRPTDPLPPISEPPGTAEPLPPVPMPPTDGSTSPPDDSGPDDLPPDLDDPDPSVDDGDASEEGEDEDDTLVSPLPSSHLHQPLDSNSATI